MASDYDILKEKLSVQLPSMSEKQKRLLVGAEALTLGRGGIARLCRITGMSCNTIAKGIRECTSPAVTDNPLSFVSHLE